MVADADETTDASGGYRYVGEELDAFAHARNWKAYLRRLLLPYLGGDVLEVGAGIGSTTRALCTPASRAWMCLEPDARFCEKLRALRASGELDPAPEVVMGSTRTLSGEARFDAVLYMDVLEHIEDDRAELERAVELLRPGGACVVLCPAHPFLYSEFDAAVGHYRRYNKRMFRALAPSRASLERLCYLDCAGMLVSSANRLLLRSGKPTVRQVKLWDRVFVSCSRFVDPLIGRRLGKSVLGVWRRLDDA